jgi:MerR family mercuric resistance operon transcriptional regulator
MTAGLRSGQVAQAAGVNVQTLRYYERRGLLGVPDRTLGGHRLYPADTVTQLRVIKAAQRLGFSLAEVADMLETAAGRRRTRGARDLPDRIRVKIDELDRQIDELSSVRAILRSCLDAGCADLAVCAGDDRCPVPFA